MFSPLTEQYCHKFDLKMENFFPHRESHISTEALYDTRVPVSQVQIDPHAMIIFHADIHFIKIKTSAFYSDVVFWDGTDGGDNVEIIPVLQTNFCWKIPGTGDVIFVNEENYRLSSVFLFQSLTQIDQLCSLSQITKY